MKYLIVIALGTLINFGVDGFFGNIGQNTFQYELGFLAAVVWLWFWKDL